MSNDQSENKKPDDEKTGTAMIWGLMIGCCLIILWVINGMSEYESDLSTIMGVG